MEKNWRSTNYWERSKFCIEEQSYESIFQENRSVQPFGASESRSPSSLFRDYQEATGSKYHQTELGKGCEALEPSVCYQKERQWLEANCGFWQIQQCNQDNVLQARKPQNSGENYTRKGLRSQAGLEPSLLSYKSHEELSPFLSFVFKGKYYAFHGMSFGYKNAPRTFTKVMSKVLKYMRDEWNVRTIAYLEDIILLHQYPQELNIIAKKTLSLFNKFQSVCGSNEGVEENRADERVPEMEEDCRIQQSCFDKEVSLVDRETECDQIRVSKSFPEFVTTVQTPKQSFESEWMARKTVREWMDN
ncbi:uncharacterized protein MONOS_5573c2 [Monocercomonoides exilis]|uniref:uncharacterized protein n=1 Tax=Monocercomonoides exilis TaxID=2049356 RepID=UPI00355A728F|nr:hypothetical protein MONOS_5573c1 [Monocercomonoides exilis]KAH7823675.1 hypothetical protein MONOS_5573c2 [Monocercomonoides exilis]|eukprot:MONOS_5573.1-p1 / transcript=MONOS_5573.1 / gene=MONOS_5573 / organism=Monocercomonoides_exilis_PA203 / gene_product=unspecified product / transcript_product=unspecified product / location=Mono_scaffold00164:20903-21811(+) / protein_length=302 / sequence_SO=supercontig / SO=protein_coding / is_pseudo=false